MQRNRKTNPVFLIGIVVLVIGGFSYQQYYLRKTLPIIQAELAEVERIGVHAFEQIAVPPWAVPRGEIYETVLTGGHRGQWRNTPIGVRYFQEWEASGTISELREWYIQRLPADGWERMDVGRPSGVQTEFHKGKWHLTVGHNVSFGGSDARVWFSLSLEWRYFSRE